MERDQLIIGVPEGAVVVGQAATLFGAGMAGESTLMEWADAIGTVGEEIVTRLSPRIPRRVTG